MESGMSWFWRQGDWTSGFPLRTMSSSASQVRFGGSVRYLSICGVLCRKRAVLKRCTGTSILTFGSDGVVLDPGQGPQAILLIVEGEMIAGNWAGVPPQAAV